jgi:CRISPR-associated endonuclease Csn1
MSLIFGFDIGTTSIGFAAIEFDPGRSEGRILRMGVRIFPEARDPKGTPLNQTRRQKRMMRRQLRRRKDRRRQLNEALQAYGLLPRFGSAEWSEVMALNPVALRARALEEALTPSELGRALYHLAKRRHFRGRDLEESEDGQALAEATGAEEAADEKAARSGREATIQALRSSGKTLGQHLSSTPRGERQRGLHALRRHVEDEFQRMWGSQARFHPELRNEDFQERIRDIVFSQRPVFWRLNTLGECRLDPGQPLAPKGSWASAQRRMLEKLNNLEIAGGNARPLDDAERMAILAPLQVQQSMSWSGARKALEPLFKARGESARNLKFNLELGGDPKLLGNPVEARLASIFGDTWAHHPQKQEIRAGIHERLWAADYGRIGNQRVVIKRAAERASDRRSAAESFASEFGASPGQVAELEKMTFPTGWDAFSLSAILKCLPELERGVRFGALLASPDYAEWRREKFPNRNQPTGEILDRLPSPANPEEQKRIASLRNPTVIRTQNELRKVVNNLIDLVGKPDLIRVELAREVGKGKAERDEILAANRNQEKRRQEAQRRLEENGIPSPSRADIEKWLLWKECQERDPYTGDAISFDALFHQGAFEVEHIWPRSRSLDDSFRNKTLCRKDVNLAKGNRTPFEYYRSDPDAWEAVKVRLDSLTSTRLGEGLSPGKARRFMAEAIPDDFASRQLNDTGYAARQAVAFLKRLWPDVGPTAPVTVQPVTGRVTAHLRRLWGLNNLLGDTGEKNREDHRHHAVDALVVACTHPGVTKALSDYWSRRDGPDGAGSKPTLLPPWPSIRADAGNVIPHILVSHRVRKKVSGGLHLETVYGNTGNDVETKSGVFREFVRRKKVENLTASEFNAIRDPHVRSVLQDFLARHGGVPKKIKWNTYPRVSPDGPEIRSVRILIRQQLELMAEVSTGYADLGSNHHIAIYRRPDGRGEFEVVSLFEAARRLARRAPVINRQRDGAEFCFSLCPGDAVEFPEDHPKRGIRIVQGVWASGVVVLHDNTDASGGSVWRPTASTLPGAGVRKISIDPIGRRRVIRD